MHHFAAPGLLHTVQHQRVHGNPVTVAGQGVCYYPVQALSDAIAALAASDYKVMQINLRISTYSDTVAACERLYKQPIPTAYTRHDSPGDQLAYSVDGSKRDA